MRETASITPVPPNPEIEARKDQFPKALEMLNDYKGILNICGASSFIMGDIIVDKQVIKGMEGGLFGMYRELVIFWFKRFCRQSCLGKTLNASVAMATSHV